MHLIVHETRGETKKRGKLSNGLENEESKKRGSNVNRGKGENEETLIFSSFFSRNVFMAVNMANILKTQISSISLAVTRLDTIYYISSNTQRSVSQEKKREKAPTVFRKINSKFNFRRVFHHIQIRVRCLKIILKNAKFNCAFFKIIPGL